MNYDELYKCIDYRSLYLTHLGPSLKDKGKSKAMALCPFHPDKNPSLSLDLDRGIFNCFACGEKGNALHFIMKLKGWDIKTTAEEIAREQRIPLTSEQRRSKVEPKVVATYLYKEADGTPSYGVDREEPGKDGESKSFKRWHLKDGRKIKIHPPPWQATSPLPSPRNK